MMGELALQHEDTPLCSALAPSLAALTHRLICHGHDPRSCLSALSQLLVVSPDAGSCVLMLLSRTVGSCPVIYLKDLVIFCKLFFIFQVFWVLVACSVTVCAFPNMFLVWIGLCVKSFLRWGNRFLHQMGLNESFWLLLYVWKETPSLDFWRKYGRKLLQVFLNVMFMYLVYLMLIYCISCNAVLSFLWFCFCGKETNTCLENRCYWLVSNKCRL